LGETSREVARERVERNRVRCRVWYELMLPPSIVLPSPDQETEARVPRARQRLHTGEAGRWLPGALDSSLPRDAMILVIVKAQRPARAPVHSCRRRGATSEALRQRLRKPHTERFRQLAWPSQEGRSGLFTDALGARFFGFDEAAPFVCEELVPRRRSSMASAGSSFVSCGTGSPS
jgi:hypothetical protein